MRSFGFIPRLHAPARLVLLTMCAIATLVGQMLAPPPAAAQALAPTGAQTTSQSASPATCPQPPQGVDLTNLPDSALVRYGLPTHDIIASDPATWARLLQHLRVRACGGGNAPSKGPSLRRGRPETSGTCNPPAPGADCNSFNWSGHEATTTSRTRGTYQKGYVHFTVPPIQHTPIGAHVAIWAGVGGDSSEAGASANYTLVQVGVDSYVDSSGQEAHLSFWEVTGLYNGHPFDSTAQALSLSIPVDKYDVMDASVTSNVSGNGLDYFFLKDETYNEYHGCYVGTTSPTPNDSSACPGATKGYAYGSSWNTDGITAECIVERASDSYLSPLPLAEWYPIAYGTQPQHVMSLSNCWANGIAIGSSPNFMNELVNSTGTALDHTSALDSTHSGFTETWYRSS